MKAAWFLCSSLCLLPSLSLAQSKTLAEFLSKTPPPQGTIRLSIDAEKVTAVRPGTGLEAFNRKPVTVGGIEAVVPTEMVVLSDAPNQPPDLYVSLSRSQKVLYLLSLLNKDQWDRATRDGIGLGDLRGEAREVFQSILPKVFQWNTSRVDNEGFPQPQGKPTTLPTEQIKNVKLRIARQLNLMPMVTRNGRSSFMYMDTAAVQLPGATVRLREDAEPAAEDLYGYPVRRVVPNRDRPSDIVYANRSWDGAVTLSGTITLGELLRQAGNACNAEVRADARIANLPVSLSPGKARAGDLLHATALSVAGSFRKVGAAYVLVPDRTGAGTRQLGLALWAGQAKEQGEKAVEAVRQRIAALGVLPQVRFDKNDPLAPNEAMRKNMEQNVGVTSPQGMPVNDLIPAARTLMRQMSRFMNPPVEYEQVGITSRLVYGFVLPDGQTLEPEFDDLGMERNFQPTPAAPPPANVQTFTPRLPSLPSDGVVRPLLVRAESASEASEAVTLAKEFGFGGVWLQTSDPKALAAAIERGKSANLPVSLAVRPWAEGSERLSDPDRTLLGNALPFFAPADLDVPVRWNRIAALARTSSLAGIVMLDTQPRGYEAEAPARGYSLYLTANSNAQEAGYSTEQRLAFIRKFGIDPIDLQDLDLNVGVDLRQPFFDDVDANRNALGQWRDYRATGNRTQVERLASMLRNANLPLLVEVRSGPYLPSRGTQIREATVVTTLTSEGKLPTGQGRTASDGDYAILLLDRIPANDIEQRAWDLQFRRLVQRGRTPQTLDITFAPANRLRTLLERSLLRPRKSGD